MRQASDIIKGVSEETKRAILFHSASGKDSIALLDLMAPYFDEIACVFMYIVPELEHIGRYINYATSKYPNVRFYHVPHFALSTYIKTGYMGCRENPDQKLVRLSDITDSVREQLGIEWAFFGFKQTDSMNRRLMLRTYRDDAICDEMKKCYPLSQYKNSDVLEYIDHHGLIWPEQYGKGQSAGTDITDINYLLFLRENYPGDLEKVLAMFPLVGRLLFEYDYKKEEAGRE